MGKKLTDYVRSIPEAMLRVSNAGHHGGPTPDNPKAEYTARQRRNMRRHPEQFKPDDFKKAEMDDEIGEAVDFIWDRYQMGDLTVDAIPSEWIDDYLSDRFRKEED